MGEKIQFPADTSFSVPGAIVDMDRTLSNYIEVRNIGINFSPNSKNNWNLSNDNMTTFLNIYKNMFRQTAWEDLENALIYLLSHEAT